MQWMQRPQSYQDCPVGLEYLTQIDRLLVEQKVDLIEVFTSWEQNNRYNVKNAAGQKVYVAVEDTDPYMRKNCGSKRGFEINIIDNFNQKILKFNREFKCFSGCSWFAGFCDCCTQEVKVESSSNQVLGYVRQTRSFYQPCFEILDENLSTVVKIEGPICFTQSLFFENSFKVLTADGQTECGRVTKTNKNLIKQMFTNADTFSIECMYFLF